MTHALHFFFGWYEGAVWSNILASVLWAGPPVVYFWWHSRCRVIWCPRPGQHPVGGTTWKVCARHHKPEHHHAVHARHTEKHPGRLAHGDTVTG